MGDHVLKKDTSLVPHRVVIVLNHRDEVLRDYMKQVGVEEKLLPILHFHDRLQIQLDDVLVHASEHVPLHLLGRLKVAPAEGLEDAFEVSD